jgi:hypothetical protein
VLRHSYPYWTFAVALLGSASVAAWYRFRWWWIPAAGAVLVAAAWLTGTY